MGKKKDEVVPVPSGTQEVSVPGISSAETLIAQAIEKNLPVETMEKLLAMRTQLKKEWAKEQFDEAMSLLQGEIPIIDKDKKVDFISKRTNSRTTYKYAPIDSIVRQTRSIIAKHGFSYVVTTVQTPNDMTAICTVKHQCGHAEATEFRVPIDAEAFMSGPQKVGAAMTFAKRYAFCNAFGIITGDEDSDAVDVDEGGPKSSPPTPPKPPIQPAPKKNSAPPPSAPPPGMESDDDIEGAASTVAAAFGGRVTDVQGTVKPPPIDEPFPDGASHGNCEVEGCKGSYQEKGSQKGRLLACSEYPKCKSIKPLPTV